MQRSSPSVEFERIRSEIQLVPIDHVPLDYLHSLLSRYHFTDPYFPPSDSSIYGTTQCKKFSIVWKRPQDFLKGKIYVFQGGIEKSDIQQGELGDCWLMCTLCALSAYPTFISKIFQNPEYSSQNFYRLRLCKDAEWQNVTVDDLIPCKKSTNEPIFSKNHGNELWVIILEKAYAKLHGSYMALKGGMAQESFEDLTGFPAFTFHFEKIQDQLSDGSFWKQALSWNNSNNILVAATSAEANEDQGIVASHYYTIIKLAECNGHKLLNLRNPWGSFEWKGPWSDGSAEWTDSMIKQLKPEFDSDDGAFWMSFSDFLNNFQRIVVGKIGFSTEKRLKSLIKINAIYGARPEEYFVLEVSERSNNVIGLHQEDERSVGVESHRPYLDLGVVIMKDDLSFVDYAAISQQHRESQIEIVLDPGTYLIVPLSGGCVLRREADLEEPRLLNEKGEFDPIFQSTLRDIFRKFDKDMDQIMDCGSFVTFMHKIGIEYEPKKFFGVILNKYTSTDAGLTLQGFYEMFYVAINQYGERTVKEWVTRLGYDEKFYSVESRAIVCTVHSTSASIRISTAEMLDELLVSAWGQAAVYKGELCSKISGVSIYIIKHEEGVSILLNNTSHERIIEIDISESKHINTCIRGELVMQINVPKDNWVIAEHLQCKKQAKSFSYSLSARII